MPGQLKGTLTNVNKCRIGQLVYTSISDWFGDSIFSVENYLETIVNLRWCLWIFKRYKGIRDLAVASARATFLGGGIPQIHQIWEKIGSWFWKELQLFAPVERIFMEKNICQLLPSDLFENFDHPKTGHLSPEMVTLNHPKAGHWEDTPTFRGKWTPLSPGPMVSLSMERPAIKALALPVPSDFNGQGIPVPFAGLGRPRWWLGETVVFFVFFLGGNHYEKKRGI